VKKLCVTCAHEKGEAKLEWEAECLLDEECNGMEKWTPEGILVVTDEKKGRKFLKLSDV